MTYSTHVQILVSTLYVNQILDLPPLTAQAAFDAVRRACASPRAPDHWVIETATCKLRLVGTGVVDRYEPLWSLRQASGRLRRRRRLTSMAVEVELRYWAERRCEIGIRPCPRTAPMTEAWCRRRYLAVAVEAVEELAFRLAAHVDDGTCWEQFVPMTNVPRRTGTTFRPPIDR
jgi:hypothetical protein